MIKIWRCHRHVTTLSSTMAIRRSFSAKSLHCRMLSASPPSQEKKNNNEQVVTDSAPLDNGLFNRLYGPQSNVASKDFSSRWLMAIPAFATHLCIGAPYAWSLMADMVTREYGFVAPAASDWSLFQSALPLSIVFLLHGISAATVGKWQAKVGPRKAMLFAGTAFGGGLAIGAAGIYLHSLPLLYLGYGVLGGTGIGLGYTPPVQALMQWFPDKKGIASGITIAGFGSGALLFTPCAQYLTKKFAKIPEYLGPASEFVTKTVDGRLFADVNGSMVEVVNATAAELGRIPYVLSEGLYVVGTGSTGAAEALGVMGLSYFAVMLVSSLLMKTPHPSYGTARAVAGNSPSPTSVHRHREPVVDAPVVLREIGVEEAVRTRQFYLLGTTFFCIATGGIGMFSVAKPMMSEVFYASMPAIVTSAFAAKFVLMLSSGNLGGRLGWAALSDTIGRRNAFLMFTGALVPLYLSVPYLVNQVVSSGSPLALYMFCGATTAAISGMGGVFAVLPAYEADMFGTKNVGAIHGRMLLFNSAAAIAGPALVLNLRALSYKKAVDDLLTLIPPEKFESAFGAPIDQVTELLAAKTVTISKLLALCPPGTLDPSPHLYDTTMFTLSGLMAVAFVSHAFVKPYPRWEKK